jgi:Protein of unknown function (DUF3489)
MDANALDTTIKTYLTDVRAKLEKGLRIAKAAEVCAGSGRTRKGMEIVLSLEPIVYELNTLLNAASMTNLSGFVETLLRPPAPFGLCGASVVAARCPPPTERRFSMSKSAKKRAVAPSATSVAVAKPPQLAPHKAKRPNSKPGSKQDSIIAMLKSPAGATIDAMMKATS